MNDRADNSNNKNFASQLDRLVDGALDPQEQRSLLAALETQPDGWRRCALTFIEAQTLRGEFRGIARICHMRVGPPERHEVMAATQLPRNFYVARCIEQKRVLIVGKDLRRPGEATNEIALPVDALAKADWA